ncbi:hypothetical protein D9M68_727020 [compost metagenome]
MVSAFTPASVVPVLLRPLRYSAPQCMAMKACDKPISVEPCNGTRMEPRLLVTCTRSPSFRPRRTMSCGLSCTAGSATWPNSRPSVPVRVMPCHWSRRRPVVSENG